MNNTTSVSEDELKKAAVTFAKSHGKSIVKQLTDPGIYHPSPTPISVFMAGSPGAGKTEFSKNFISSLEINSQLRVVRIDGDELRSSLPGYSGSNSHLFQGAISILVEKMHDVVLAQQQSFVLDGTLSRYEKAVANIQRSLNKGRIVSIFYIYQKPEIAWQFTQQREQAEGRHIPKAAFIQQFCDARDTIQSVHEQFGKKVHIFLVKKDFQKNEVEDVIELDEDQTPVDYYIPQGYTKEDLTRLL